MYARSLYAHLAIYSSNRASVVRSHASIPVSLSDCVDSTFFVDVCIAIDWIFGNKSNVSVNSAYSPLAEGLLRLQIQPEPNTRKEYEVTI